MGLTPRPPCVCACYFFLPSVAHPPLPLQEFLPAQECFSATPAAAALLSFDPSVAHPPLPLQEFFPAQACFSATAFELFVLLVACPLS